MADDYEDDASAPDQSADQDALGELDRKGRLLRKFARWDQALEEHWSDWQREARRNFKMVAGHQYERDELDQLKSQNKPHAVFNRIGPIIDAVVGAQINGRQQVEYFPREVGDSQFNELITRGAEWIRDRGDANTEETDAFRDCFICGVGVIETRLDYEVDPEGQVIYNRLDPVSVLFDPASTKPNFLDARYVRYEKLYSRDEFKELYPGVPVEQSKGPQSLATYTSDPSQSYNGSDDERRRSTDVAVRMYQWFEVNSVAVFQPPIDPMTGQPVGEPLTLPVEEYYRLQVEEPDRYAEMPPAEIVRERVYKYATVGAGVILDEGELGTDRFTIAAVTGKRDEEEGTWYGLVRPMQDPQVWANTFFNMMLHIMRTNAKGGVMVEEGAVEDMREFQRSWSASDGVTVLADGAISQGRMVPKPSPQVPAGIQNLMTQAVDAIQQVSGVNPEILGLANREQAGVLEVERKRSVYGLLAQFFDSFRRYRQNNGYLLLEYMRQMPGQLVRVTAGTGSEQYVPLIMQDDSVKYDVIVSEAPDGPHQKQQTFAMIQALLPLLMQSDLSPEVWAKLLEYTPLPASLVQQITQALLEPDEEGQQEAMIQSAMEQAELASKQAKAQKDQADAAKKLAEANATAVEATNLRVYGDADPQSIV